jgi:sulfur carrier protein
MNATPEGSAAAAPTITIQVNGEGRAVPAGLSLEALLPAIGFQPRLVVVEFNGEILPRDRWGAQPVVESDALEVVTIVGGGS